MIVVRKHGSSSPAVRSITLEPLEGGDQLTSFEWPRDPDTEAGEMFEVVHEVHGRCPDQARFAVYADWQVAPGGDSAGFEKSRRELFELRVAFIDCFCVDFLLRRLDDPTRQTVLGLYGERAGLDLCRSEPHIAEWAKENRPSQWGAEDVSGMKFFRVK